MKLYKSFENKNLISEVLEGAVGVIPTDTIYGIVASALNHESVERIYDIKGRKSAKPFIILISDISDLENFGIKLSGKQEKLIKDYWPGPNSLIFSCPGDDYSYLTRGTKSLAFRIPAKDDLREFLAGTGPLVAPSANLEGEEPAQTIDEAITYFLDRASFYLDAGTVVGSSSNIIDLTGDTPQIIR